MRIVFLAVLLMLSGRCLAQMAAPDRRAAGTEAGVAVEEAYPHPVISDDGEWAGTLGLAIGFMFMAALLVGLVVTHHMPPEPLPETGGHDDHGDQTHPGGAGAGHGAHH